MTPQDTDIKKCGIGEKYCICSKIPCHRKNKYVTWMTFANKNYPIASTGDIDLADPFVKVEVIQTIIQAEREQEVKKVLEVADKTIATAKTAIAEGKKYLGSGKQTNASSPV
jgi:hypothetical protein